MPKLSLQSIVQWLGVLEQVQAKGAGAYEKIKAALVDHGIEADLAALDADMIDAERRRILAAREAAGEDTTIK